ncbi:MAG: porin family protein [Weeksellaceae bacterium]|jgi:hypothetical protein|nr:porin family protein [Weeksellaceae bacterium]MDX9705004.1 porin family protein [Weeksellaceae bacterium]
MKKLFLLGFTLFSMSAFAQNLNFGVKAGLVYSVPGKLSSSITEIKDMKGKGAAGFQAGAMLRLKAAGFYVQPELLYTSLKSEYEEDGMKTELKKNRIDVPINVGKTFALGLVQIQTGPVFSLNFKEKFSVEDINIDADKTDNINLGWQIGTGINLKSLNIDLRYEFGLSKTTSKFIESTTNTSFETKNKSNSLNLSVGYFF